LLRGLWSSYEEGGASRRYITGASAKQDSGKLHIEVRRVTISVFPSPTKECADQRRASAIPDSSRFKRL
jgi:hypothetical protein